MKNTVPIALPTDGLTQSSPARVAHAVFQESPDSALAHVLDSTLSFIGVLELDGTLRQANKAALSRANLSREAVIGKRFWECYWWSYDASVAGALERAVQRAAAGEQLRYDVAVRVGEHERIFIDFMLQPVCDAEGQVQYLVASGVDINERVEHARALAASEASFRELANSMPQLVWMATADGNVEYYNDKYRLYAGIEQRGTHYEWAPVLHPDDLARTEEVWRHSLATGEPYACEHRLALREGGYRWVISRASPVHDQHNKVVKWYGTATDIHALKEAAELKDHFMAVASHELKTPVTSIKAYAQVLEHRFRKQGEEKAADLVAKIDGQLDKLTALISDMLDATRIEQGKLRMRLSDFNVQDLVREVAEDVGRSSLTHRIVCSFESTCMLHGDRERVGQVVTNLLTNAIKYSPGRDSVRVHVACAQEGDTPHVCVRVEDDGIGMDSTELIHVFDRFYRAHGDEHDTYPGLGLGLYIAKEIVERHHGRIWAESVPGKGSTFYMTVPCAGSAAVVSSSQS